MKSGAPNPILLTHNKFRQLLYMDDFTSLAKLLTPLLAKLGMSGLEYATETLAPKAMNWLQSKFKSPTTDVGADSGVWIGDSNSNPLLPSKEVAVLGANKFRSSIPMNSMSSVQF